jgi:hypothetical protein
MKKTFLFIAALALVAIPIAVPHFASAAASFKSDIWNPADILKGPLIVCSGTGSPNLNPPLSPCQSLCDLVSQILNIIYFIIAVVIWIIVPIDVAIGGIMILLAGGNSNLYTKAKTILLGAAWAIGITLCSYIIVATFVNVMNITGVGGFDPKTSVCSTGNSGTNGPCGDNGCYDSNGNYIGNE